MTHIKKTHNTYIIASLFVLAIFPSCKQQPDYKAIRQQVVNVHDTIMKEDGKLMADESMLKSMITPARLTNLQKGYNIDTAAEKIKATALIHRLDSVSDAMSDWMGQFNPDVQNKNAEQARDYFGIERIKVSKLDSSYKVILKSTGEYLGKFHLKAADSSATKMKMKM
jgi:hypothetical protein